MPEKKLIESRQFTPEGDLEVRRLIHELNAQTKVMCDDFDQARSRGGTTASAVPQIMSRVKLVDESSAALRKLLEKVA